MIQKTELLQGLQKLEKRLSGRDRVFTIGDAAAISGFPMDEAKQILDRLMEKYDCRLKVTDQGDLIYDFGSYLHVRGERTWEEWWYGVKQSLWKAFVFVFKIWITITLVVYFIIFLVILIALIIAMMSGNKDNNSSSSSNSGDGLLALIGDIFRSIFIWNHYGRSYHYETDSRGYKYRSFDNPKTLLNKKKQDKGFVASVYDFVFGPPRVEATQQENLQEVATFLRQNKGLIVKPELVALGGWESEKADDFFSEVIVKYQGDAKINEHSVLYGDFFELARTAGADNATPIVWYWDEYVPEYKLTGNSFWRNIGIGFMNLFNLAFASFFLFSGLNAAGMGELDSTGIFIGLGLIPFLFSFLFFLVPMLRYLQLLPLRKKRLLENIRKRLMKVIYNSSEVEIPLQQLEQAVNTQGKTEEKLSPSDVESMMQRLIHDFGGEIELKNNGQVVYKFENLREEKQEALQLRERRESGKDLGKIVFDTEN